MVLHEIHHTSYSRYIFYSLPLLHPSYFSNWFGCWNSNLVGLSLRHCNKVNTTDLGFFIVNKYLILVLEWKNKIKINLSYGSFETTFVFLFQNNSLDCCLITYLCHLFFLGYWYFPDFRIQICMRHAFKFYNPYPDNTWFIFMFILFSYQLSY